MHITHGPTNSSSTNGGSTNGTATNGSSRGKARADATNGHTNGDRSRHLNGDADRQQMYRGHNKRELVRLMMQSLQEMGYEGAASSLEAESGVELESPSVAALRYAVLNGEWADAEMLLLGVARSSSPGANGSTSDLLGGLDETQGLPLKPGIEKNELRLSLRRQKYLELLEQRDHGRALMVLRQELTPLRPPVDQLHTLSGLMVCPTVEELKKQAGWGGALGGSRPSLLENLSQSIHHSVIVPPSRLANLLAQTKKSWVGNCVWHNPIEPISLFIDHTCERDQFPLHPVMVLNQTDEVYHVAFSNNGRWLAASGKDNAAVIYEVGGSWPEKLRLAKHTGEVGFVAWSPDDSLLVTCSKDKSAKLWDTSDGSCIATLAQFSEPVAAVAWLPDGSGFVTGAHDIRNPLLLWRVSDLVRKLNKEAAVIPAHDFRVQDVAVTPDATRLLAISNVPKNGHLSIFDLQGPSYEERLRVRFEAGITCLNVSRDGRYVLLNLNDCKLQCIDLDTMEVIQRYSGQVQNKYVIRSALGGADENLVISGSEDGKIYVFHRERGTLIETLQGHQASADGESRCVNSVAWNPADLCMFASCGDDGTIRIWSKGNTYTPATTRRTSSDASINHDATVERPGIDDTHFASGRHGSTSAAPTLL